MARRRMKDLWAEAEQDKNLRTVGGRIRYARLSQGLTQLQVADALPEDRKRKKSRASIAQYEMSRKPPGVDVIRDLAAILNEDPCYLAFGERLNEPTPPIQGQRVPIKHLPDPKPPSPRLRSDFAAPLEGQECAVFPRRFLTDLGVGRGRVELIRVDFDAPTFGIRKHEYVLVDAEAGRIEADGQLYAISTPTGVTLVRSEPIISGAEGVPLNVTSGHGSQQSLSSDSIKVVGRVVASLQRRS